MIALSQPLNDFISVCKKYRIIPTHFILIVSIAGQTVSLFENSSTPLRLCVEDYQFVKKLPCSTSRFGIGQMEGSNRTPHGVSRPDFI